MKLARLSRALGLGEDPAPILERMQRLYREIDREVANGSDGLELPCKAGCDACCHEAVFLSAPEFLQVAAHLLAHRTEAELNALVEEMRLLADRFEDELLLLEELPPGLERDEVAERVKFRCPLLGGDGCCTIYEARELNARTFGLTWDAARGHPFGCELTHGRLRVLPPEHGPRLFDAREARRRLMNAVPATERVHVYPWWFARYGAILLGHP
jgi:Fe-S-cluster containining protein